MRKNNEREFADVDKIQEAAKLDRHERPGNRLSAEQKADLILTGILASLPVFLMAAMVLLAMSR